MTEISLSLLSAEKEENYEKFLQEHKGALFNHSLKYRNFLRNTLEDSEDLYILAYQDDQIIGILPIFLKRFLDGKSVINSLPFFGSHGGILIANNINNSSHIKKILLDKLFDIANEKKAISLTIVDNPTAVETEFYESYFKKQPSDKRISQITDISVLNKDDVDNELMAKFHYKTRNMVRKSLKSGFSIQTLQTVEAFKVLHGLHSQNMKAIDGKEKPFFVFENIQKIFEAEKDYHIYFAKKNNEIAAGLLIFYYKDYCEYFTPVINQKYRSEQPLSLLIFKAMQDAARRGYLYWNWGGTWLTQDGVYLFKKRWGAKDQVYNYFNKIFNLYYIEHSEKSIIDNSYFYIYPIPKSNEV